MRYYAQILVEVVADSEKEAILLTKKLQKNIPNQFKYTGDQVTINHLTAVEGFTQIDIPIID